MEGTPEISTLAPNWVFLPLQTALGAGLALIVIIAGLIELGQSSTNTPEETVPISFTLNSVKGVAEVTFIATSLILSAEPILGLDFTIFPIKEADIPPLLCTQSYTLVKIGVPLLVVILTSSYWPAGLPITINHTSALLTGLLKVYIISLLKLTLVECIIV